MSENFQRAILFELMLFFEPITDASSDQDTRHAIMAAVGWVLDNLPHTSGSVGEELDTAFQALGAVADQLDNLLATPPDSLDALQKVLATLSDLFKAVRDLSKLSGTGVLPELGTLGEDLIQILVFAYLLRWIPLAYYVLALLTLIALPEDTQPTGEVRDASGTVVRKPYYPGALHLDRISHLLTDPVQMLRDEYVPSGLSSDAAAQAAADKLFPRLGGLLYWLGADTAYNSQTHTLSVVLPPIANINPPSLTLALSATEGGLVVTPSDVIAITQQVGQWSIDIQLNAAGRFVVGAHGLTTGGSVIGKLALVKQAQPGTPAVHVGSQTGTRLEVGGVSITGEFNPDPAQLSYDLLAAADSATIVIAAGDGDGFLQSILPGDGLRADFDLGLGWSNRNGFYLRGSASLEMTFASHVSLGPISLQGIHVALGPRDDALGLELSTLVNASLGPVTAVIDRVGLAADILFQDGNFGPLDLTFGFQPPDGVGLTIDAEGVTGGGYLAFGGGQYSGALELLMEEVRIKAVGLLETQMPGGAPGYSLAALLSAEFLPPINLPLGFTLNAVGGLLAVNRTMSLDGLKARYKAHTIDSLLFPPDPVGNAPQVIHALQTLFPPQDGHYIIGPAVKIGWGSPSLATAKLGIFVELFASVRIALLGALSAVLPDQDHPSVVLQLDVLGIIDLQQKTAAIDASLHDSKIESFPVLGDMALRLGWGTPRTFVLAIGGVHPLYTQLPANFPQLQRASVIIAQGNDPRLTLSAYLAVTSNSVQFGADLELSASAGGFSVHGYLTFDALFIFSPAFSFDTEVKAGVEVRGYGLSVGVKLDLHLSGPRPWYVDGTATVSAWLISYSVHVHATIGIPSPIPLPAVDPTQPLMQAFSDPGSWSVALPDGVVRAVSIAKPPPPTTTASPAPTTATDGASPVLLDPMGLLAVTERVLPLGMTLQWFGNAAPANVNRFDVQSVTLADLADPHSTASAAPIEPAQDYFARAQFLTMTDAQKLSEPAFDLFDAGVKVGAQAFQPGQQTTVPVTYETLLVDDLRLPARPGTDYHPSAAVQVAQSRHSAASQSLARTAGARRFTVPGMKSSVALSPVTYVVASTQDLSIHPAMQDLDAAGGVTYTRAAERLQAYLAAYPSEARSLQVLPRYECKGVAA